MAANATFDDDILIKRVIAGEAEYFTDLVQRHLGVLKTHICSMLRNATDVDDLMQEVLLKLWLHLPAFRFESSFRTWAVSIATNEVRQSYRRKQRGAFCQPVEDLEYFPSNTESPMQNALRLERAQAVRRGILRLPAKYRQILVVRYIQERNERETAHFLKSSVAGVRTRTFRARQMLRTSLQPTILGVPDRSNGFVRQSAPRA